MKDFFAPNDLLLKYLYPKSKEFCFKDLFCTPPWNKDSYTQRFDLSMQTVKLRVITMDPRTMNPRSF